MVRRCLCGWTLTWYPICKLISPMDRQQNEPRKRTYRRCAWIATTLSGFSVDFNMETGELHIHFDYPGGSEFPCPECNDSSKVYDSNVRQWRHLNFFEHRTFPHASVPRVNCKRCGVKTVRVPWSRPESGFTLLFEAIVIMLCRSMPGKSRSPDIERSRHPHLAHCYALRGAGAFEGGYGRC